MIALDGTILTGFLGSGKTTLVQYIVNSIQHRKHIAVIENKVAPTSSSGYGSTTDSNNSFLASLIKLPNGCLCCTVKDSLVETLKLLLTKRRDFDYMLIKCNGLANPGPITGVFRLDDALESRLRLDGIGEYRDAAERNGVLWGDGGNDDGGGGEAAQQIAYADRILLNKIDLLNQSQHTSQPHSSLLTLTSKSNPSTTLEDVQALISGINPTAALHHHQIFLNTQPQSNPGCPLFRYGTRAGRGTNVNAKAPSSFSNSGESEAPLSVETMIALDGTSQNSSLASLMNCPMDACAAPSKIPSSKPWNSC
eukprot:CAMPEP_0194445638 /NCGR_PEP_ID=MMETSP0176-20130528/127980_1 /TAXON_ID=216777 /ORGANISM="Proboscia alata, Strain PI-D3" /LENGTH=308 /DNA_ID=CAMNT_0039272233 /DNA_START=335 /DNA_END=1262 /DNA_ORIENTATION=+